MGLGIVIGIRERMSDHTLGAKRMSEDTHTPHKCRNTRTSHGLHAYSSRNGLHNMTIYVHMPAAIGKHGVGRHARESALPPPARRGVNLGLHCPATADPSPLSNAR